MTASVQRIRENNDATNYIYISIPGYIKIIVMLLQIFHCLKLMNM